LKAEKVLEAEYYSFSYRSAQAKSRFAQGNRMKPCGIEENARLPASSLTKVIEEGLKG
jgi:hypothetical protein